MQLRHCLIIEHDAMARVDVNKPSDEQKIRVLKKVVEKYGLSYVARELGVDRSTLYRYVSGKVKKVPDNVIAAVAETLDLEEPRDVLYGFRTVNVDPTVALSVVIKALRDEGLRNFVLTLLYHYMGGHLRTTLTPIA